MMLPGQYSTLGRRHCGREAARYLILKQHGANASQLWLMVLDMLPRHPKRFASHVASENAQGLCLCMKS